jgi:hypothetical protein
MNSTSTRSARLRYLVAAVVVCAALATAMAVNAAAAGGSSASRTSVHTIHLVGHETQSKVISQGGYGDQEVFSGILDNAAGSSQVGNFAGTLITVSSTTPPVYLATVDLQLQGGQITVQGFLDSSKSPIVHAVTGGTGIYRGARGEFSFTEPSRGVLDITVTLPTAGSATALAALRVSASGTSVHTIHLVGHETQNKFLSQGGYGDDSISAGILDNAAGNSQVGNFAGTLTSVASATPPLTISTLDLQLQGGQITVQGFVDTSKSPSVTAVTGGTGTYRGARGEFSFTEPTRGVLDITVTLM